MVHIARQSIHVTTSAEAICVPCAVNEYSVRVTLTTLVSLYSGHMQRENDEKSERITILESQMDALLKAKDEVSGDTRIYLYIVNEYM